MLVVGSFHDKKRRSVNINESDPINFYLPSVKGRSQRKKFFVSQSRSFHMKDSVREAVDANPFGL
jgi:hypothetical protein